ncbi:MAG: hypothetical protein Unbinned1502contig1001_41 [Prokaryotic dsDNA virus sp.]|nr:MAG: hypothetical protein Unbinned1502contig1001_41 [Prokaryotic dsDNA virus sp.]|tara:strand:- start:396 stop:566 length:171 start_codon:yes stop_codon:yes gene_type:complete
MKVVIKENAKYQITFEWVRESREVTTEWLSAKDARNLIDLCNANPIRIGDIKEKAA